jgi:hypothetical protein
LRLDRPIWPDPISEGTPFLVGHDFDDLRSVVALHADYAVTEPFIEEAHEVRILFIAPSRWSSTAGGECVGMETELAVDRACGPHFSVLNVVDLEDTNVSISWPISRADQKYCG